MCLYMHVYLNMFVQEVLKKINGSDNEPVPLEFGFTSHSNKHEENEDEVPKDSRGFTPNPDLFPESLSGLDKFPRSRPKKAQTPVPNPRREQVTARDASRRKASKNGLPVFSRFRLTQW